MEGYLKLQGHSLKNVKKNWKKTNNENEEKQKEVKKRKIFLMIISFTSLFLSNRLIRLLFLNMFLDAAGTLIYF